MKNLFAFGRMLIGICFLIAGWIHFRYGAEMADAIPAWLGSGKFWMYLVGALWCCTAISFLFNIIVKVSTLLTVLLLLIVMAFEIIPHFAGPSSFIHLAFATSMIAGCLMIYANAGISAKDE
ncbi:MAG: hypothetical protein ACRDDZ_04955 [Marinifilaceae bacterium]